MGRAENERSASAGTKKRKPRSSAAIGREWASIGLVLGTGFVRDVRDAVRLQAPPGERRDHDRAIRRFCAWLIAAPRDLQRLAMVKAFSRKPEVACDDPYASAADALGLAALFDRFADELAGFASLKRTSTWHEARLAAISLEWVGKIQDRNYPEYWRVLFKRPLPIGETTMLGSLPFAKAVDLPPGAAREAAALDVMLRLSLTEFRDHVALLNWGEDIRSGKRSTSGSGAALECIRGAFLLARSRLSKRTPGRMRQHRSLLAGVPDEILDPVTWVAAGMSEACKQRFMPGARHLSRAAAGRLVLACLGPSAAMVRSGAAVIATARGWNKCAILNIPAQPYVLQFGACRALGSSAFIAAMKKRAGHFVVMLLNGVGDADQALIAEFTETWRETANGSGHDVTDEMLLDEASDDPSVNAVVEVVETLRLFGEAVRRNDPSYFSCDRLFAFVSLNQAKDDDATNPDDRIMLSQSTTPLIADGGVSFASIRASYLFLKQQRSGSLPRTMAAAGQTTNRVTARHYLNRREFGQEIKQALGFFQSVLQSFLLADGSRAVRLGLAPKDVDRLKRLSWASGMSACFGIDVPEAAAAPTLIFKPTFDSLRDLFLVLWSLRVAARTLPPALWRACCLEPFTAAMAIAAELRSSGLGAVYAKAARSAYEDHRAGLVSLPVVEGGRS